MNIINKCIYIYIAKTKCTPSNSVKIATKGWKEECKYINTYYIFFSSLTRLGSASNRHMRKHLDEDVEERTIRSERSQIRTTLQDTF